MRHFFVKLYDFFEKKPLFLWVLLLVVIVGCVFGVTRLRFVEDIGSFFPKGGDNKRVNYAYQHIGADNRIVISISEADKKDENIDYDLLTSAVEAIAERLSADDTAELTKDILYRIEQEKMAEITAFVLQNMPYFLENEDYERMDTLLDRRHIAAQLETDKFILSTPSGLAQDVILSDPLFLSNSLLQKLSGFQYNEEYHQEDGYIFNRQGDEAVVVVTSRYPVSETANNAKLIELIDRTVDSVAADFDNQVKISSFGASQVSLTNSRQIKKDSLWAILLSLVFIVALLVYYYRNIKSILLIICTLCFGGLFALGLIVLFRNPVSLIAVGVASIIIGIAVNYPIHLISHFKRTEDKRQIIKEIVNPLLIGNITTVGAFLSLLFISSDAMSDLGLFAALLLAGTICFVLVFLPHFLGKRPENWKTGQLSFQKVAEFHPEKSPWIVTLILVLTVVFLFFSSRTSFETDMHKINYMTEEQRASFDKLLAESDTSVQTVYCVAEGETPEQALRNYEVVSPVLSKMLSDSVITKLSGISVFVPSEESQRKRLAQWNDFWSSRREQFLADFEAEVATSGFNPAAFDAFREILAADYAPQPLTYFDPIVQDLASSYLVVEDDKTMVYSVLTVPKSCREKVEETLNAVNPAIFAFTDTSVVSRMVAALSGDFDYVLYICGFIVFAFLLFSFGRIELALSAFVPLTLAWVWILGLMGIFDMKFNIVNIILATFIFGQGDDYTIFVTEGVMYEYTYGKKMLAQFKNSIILSSLIMFIGIGMLIFAKHPAMRSLAEVTIVGMFSVVMMAYVFPPLIFRWLTTAKGQPRPIPITLWNLLKTVFSFTVFLLCTLVLSLIALFGLLFLRRSDGAKRWFHRLVCGTFKVLAKLMPQVPFEIRNPHGETFEKPAVILCNHQSHLDLLYTLLLSPKVVALTNRWLWNCPFYGWIIRYADFLPIVDGIEENLPKLKKLVEKGYSVMVFPEGTRSADCSILRFHQGAFLLAERLGLDIVPIVTHGIGHIFPKNEFILHKGRVDISIFERISVDNQEFRKDKSILEQVRAFRKFYQEKYAEIAIEVEDAGYYLPLVKGNYLYKGKEIQQSCKKELSDFENIRKRIDELPEVGSVLVKNCGYGERVLLAALVKRNLQIFSLQPSEEFRWVAEHCASRPENLHFIEQYTDNEDYTIVIETL